VFPLPFDRLSQSRVDWLVTFLTFTSTDILFIYLFNCILILRGAMINDNLPNITDGWGFPQEYYSRSLKLLDFALEQIPVYKAWRILDPGNKYPVDTRFASLPSLTKKDIRDNFPDGLLPTDKDFKSGLASGEIELVETSGTSDDKVTNIWNQKWWDASERSSWQLNSQIAGITAKGHREAILVNPKNVGIISDDADLPMEKRRLSRFLYLNEKTNPVSWSPALMDRMIEELSIFKPDVLEANPSLLARFCRYAATASRKVFQPGIIVFTYEFPTVFHYRQIGRVFQSTMISSYGTTETGCVFTQCEAGKFHQNSEFCRVDFQPFKPQHGGPLLSRILVTPFDNPWSYFLKFDTGDIVCLEQSKKCSCGRNSGLILSSINGRVTNLTLTCEGRLVTLYELDNAISVLDGIDEYKLIQTDKTSYELHLVSRCKDKQNLTDNASGVLRKLYGQNAGITVIFDNAVLPESSGKYQLAKSLFPIDTKQYLDPRFIPNNVAEV
jgi:phenylacetate-coenzyme A ligase PaaK-like adenylate-forming protein